ncbi:MAG TPA: translation initiation factor, partial [Halomonas sp.]|nr:translation initiation factor [Halomonas sp.]
MASLRDQLGGLVYSTEYGKTCPTCRKALDACHCDDASEKERLAALDGVVRIRRETSGRKGKGVTTVSGIPLSSDELKTLAKSLK